MVGLSRRPAVERHPVSRQHRASVFSQAGVRSRRTEDLADYQQHQLPGVITAVRTQLGRGSAGPLPAAAAPR